MKKPTALAIGLGLLMAGCAAKKPVEVDPVEQDLLEAVKRIESSWTTLGKIEQARHQELLEGKAQDDLGDIPPSLLKKVSVSWQGEVEPLMKKLTREAGYRLVVIGKKPSVPVWVSVDAHRRPLIEIIRNLGYQLGARAGIAIHVKSRKIDVVYPSKS